jgi:DNA-binding NarL/FixJ family response regulator
MSTPHTPEPSRLTFLVQNNHQKIRQHIDGLLKSRFGSSKIVLVNEFTSSLDLLIESRPDIFIIDLEQDKLGAQIIQLMNLLNLDTRVIVTADNDPGTIDLCISIGVKGFIVKPIDDSLFIRTVEDII